MRKIRMNIARVVCGLGILGLFTACANQRSEAPAAPAASPASVSTAPTQDEERAPTPAAAPPPAPALAPEGLDQPKSAAATEDLSTLEAAERALNQAKADLDRLALAGPTPELGRNADGAEKKDARRGAPSAAGASAPAASAPSGQCEDACRAFASLTRAASAVCRLDGDGGSHCSHAKSVVTESQRRVASCTCPAPGQ
jgi:hypothetical protein